MVVPITWVHMGLGAALVALSVPLVLRRVPMNRWYGVRVRKAFVSDSNWYELNAYGGRLLLGSGALLIVFGYLGADAAPPPTSLWAPVYLAAPLLLLIPVCALIAAFARRLPDEIVSRRKGGGA